MAQPRSITYTDFLSISSSHCLCLALCMARASSKSCSYYPSTMRLPRRRLAHGFVYLSRGFSMAVCCSPTSGMKGISLQIYIQGSPSSCVEILFSSICGAHNLPRMGGGVYTRVGTLASTLPCYALSLSPSITTGLVIALASQMYGSFFHPFMYCGIKYSHTAARQRSGRQEARRRVSSACHLQLSKLSCLRALSPALRRGAYNHLQRLYVAGGRGSHYSSLCMGLMALAFSSHIRKISRRGGQRDMRCASSSHFLRWRLSFM
jgi:hypothetical protein